MKLDFPARRLTRKIGRAETKRIIRRASRRGGDDAATRAVRKRLRAA